MTSIEPLKPIFEESFQDNRHGWPIKDNSEFTAKIESSSYLLQHKMSMGSSSLVWNAANISDLYEQQTFCIHAELENISHSNSISPYSKSFFGIAWKLSDLDNYFEFVISSTKHYRITKTIQGIYYEIVPWKYCHQIKPLRSKNILEIKKEDDLLEFCINGLSVDLLSVDKSLPGKKFGFVLYNKTVVKAHSLTICAPNSISFMGQESSNGDSLEKVFADINSLVGLERAKQQLFSLATFLEVQIERQKRGLKAVNTTLHLALYGPPGTGKTTLARLVGRLYKQLGFLHSGHVVETDRAGLVGGLLDKQHFVLKISSRKL